MQIEACRKAGISDDDIAKFVSANGGKTTVNRVLDYINQGANAAESVGSAIGNAIAPVRVDAKGMNNSMLNNAWRNR